VCLLGELAGFEDESAVTKWNFNAGWIHRHGCDPFVYRQDLQSVRRKSARRNVNDAWAERG
jgi:hypothetical protein